MRGIGIVAIFLMLAPLVCGAEDTAESRSIPPDLVGEWATPKSPFVRVVLTSGNAFYILGDGMAGMFAAAPPSPLIGIRGEARYDASGLKLTFTLLDDDNRGRPRRTIVFAYDTQLLRPGAYSLVVRTQDEKPGIVLAMVYELPT
jgi:hypothetical protein